METESEMRVIAGKARRLNLKTIPGTDTRPTTDRIKETLFNILQPELPDCRDRDRSAQPRSRICRICRKESQGSSLH